VSAADLSATLAALYDQPGPFISIYLDTESAVEDATARLETRWKDVVRDLREHGVDDATIDALSAARGGHELGNTRVLIAVPGRVLFARSLPEGTDTDVIRVAPLPYLLPLVDWSQTRVPHLVVLTDREGADVLAYETGADPVETSSVDSGRYPVHKTGVGGWSEHRYQLRVEENWKASAKEVAETVERIARDVDPRVIVVAGDSHAVSGLREHLEPRLAEKMVVIRGGRARDGSDEVTADHVLATLADWMREDVQATLAEFAKYRNRAEEISATHPAPDGIEVALNAADGVADTVAALRKAQVGTLLLGEDLDEDAPILFGPAPTQLALRDSELHDLGVEQPRMGWLVDVLIRAALGTGAEIRLVPAGTEQSPTDGVGALLRYSDTAAGAAAS
jgi:hypothetical protein